MTQQPIRNYFALESGEFLDRMEDLVERPGAPDLSALVGLARSVRGSARIAGASDAERGAAAFEKALRRLMDEEGWKEEHRPLAVSTLDDLRVLVRAHAGGGSGEGRAAAIVDRWGEPAAAPDERPSPGAGEGLLPFVRGELITLAGLLDEVVAVHRAGGDAESGVRRVLQRMRVVRGVRGGGAVSEAQGPLSEVEALLALLLKPDTPLDDEAADTIALAAEVLRDAEDALLNNRSPRTMDSLDRFRERRTGVTGESADIVSITSFFPDDDSAVLISSRTAPVPPADGELPGEVVNFVRIETTALLDQAEAAAAGAAEAGGPDRLAMLAEWIADMAASYRLTGFAESARQVAERARSGSDRGLVEIVRALRARLAAALGEEPAAEPEAEVVPAVPETEGPDEEVVPVEQLVYRGDAALEAALGLRAEVERLLAEGGGGEEDLRARVAEVFDLIELGRGDGAAAGA